MSGKNKPECILALANRIDYEQLWRISPLDAMELPSAEPAPGAQAAKAAGTGTWVWAISFLVHQCNVSELLREAA
jgi:hypothetical protein